MPGPAAARRRLLVTRPAEQCPAWVGALQAAGLPAEALPLLAVGPLDDRRALQAAWARLGDWRLLVFVSPNAVQHFFEARPADCAWPATTQAAAPGPGSAAALRAAGVPAAQVVEPRPDAERFDTESLWAVLQARPGGWAGQPVLILRGLEDAAPAARPPSRAPDLPGAQAGVGREWLGRTLEAAGASVETLACYRRGAPPADAALQARLLALREAAAETVWLFSSAEALDHLARLEATMPPLPTPWRAASTALCTHARIAARARAAGFARVEELPPQPAAVIDWWRRAAAHGEAAMPGDGGCGGGSEGSSDRKGD